MSVHSSALRSLHGSARFGATVVLLGSLLAACSDDGTSGEGTGGSSNTGGSSTAGSGGSRTGGSSGQSGSSTGGASSAGNGSGGSKGGGAGGAMGGGVSGGASGSAGASEGGSTGEGGADGESGAGGVNQGGAAGAAGAGAGGGPLDDTPILERTPRLTYTCSAANPLAPLEIRPWFGGDLASAAAGVLFLRGESSETGTSGDVVLSTLDAAGTLGSPTPLDSVEEGYFNDLRLVRGADGFGAVWFADYAGAGHASFAELDVQGAVRTDAVALDGFAIMPNGLEISAAGDSYALLWADYDETFTTFTLRLGLLDASGAFDGEPIPLREADINMTATGLVAFGDGFVAAYVEQGLEPQSFLLFLGADGTPQGEPVPLGQSSFAGGVSFLVRGDELFVAHTVATGEQFEMAATAVSIARFDASGAPSGPDVLLLTPVIDVDNVDGQLVAYGDEIGLVWSQGSIIYICAGCMPDNHLRFVVLDGYDLTPLSEVVVLENLQPQGGFIRPRMANAGDEFVITSTLMYHVDGEGASAGIACGPPE